MASVLVPFVAATTGHQVDNAKWMAQQQAAIHLPQSELTPHGVAALLSGLTRDACLAMALAARGVGKRDANEAIADVLEQLAGKS